MKKLVFGALIAAVVSQAAGCIISSSDPNAYITVSWTLKTSVTESVATCPPGYDTAALYSQEVDSTGVAVGSPIIDLFNCDAGIGTTAALAPSLYNEWIEITNTNNTSQFAKSKSNLDENKVLDVISTDLAYSTEVIVDGGYFGFAWNLIGMSSGAPLSCASAGASGSSGGIELQAFVGTSTTALTSDLFTCADQQGLTKGVPAGTYTVNVDAFMGGTVLGVSQDMTKTISPPSALHPVTELGTITVPISGL